LEATVSPEPNALGEAEVRVEREASTALPADNSSDASPVEQNVAEGSDATTPAAAPGPADRLGDGPSAQETVRRPLNTKMPNNYRPMKVRPGPDIKRTVLEDEDPQTRSQPHAGMQTAPPSTPQGGGFQVIDDAWSPAVLDDIFDCDDPEDDVGPAQAAAGASATVGTGSEMFEVPPGLGEEEKARLGKKIVALRKRLKKRKPGNAAQTSGESDDPPEVEKMIARGKKASTTGDPGEAVKCFDAVLEMTPGHKQALFLKEREMRILKAAKAPRSPGSGNNGGQGKAGRTMGGGPSPTGGARARSDCLSCGGSGDCFWCEGAGSCDMCGGSGSIGSKECTTCNGGGKCSSCSGTGKCFWC